ncbi:MAG: 50S ribosomal protein L6 [Candidatus Ryanbacteria bacterium RIFCSPHIGHO2_12_FULL_47_12b]|uniref:Large ribosomal subunit protein uL6 n=2 Tax=Candidatus Ryaniibacteriota TaxID=1817914 RepID=A0A1G2H3U3_9BACT|nr:MAG: 50S ribosomal protein L6 [Parcubacteria group bacterium GW2011_GWA2_47_10b]KKU86091.1 MAG: 50S ribosomal protein L6 [Parcubacteria group bacterium GW2011_GWA1_47_9]OGZ44749.1 MAG: 50S ribosomal protein L6 [Candidatus Ryanbacteria bacterium RIFCSPHIGHO2_01_FULL_48_80]OGZ48298.1 MAG: 50S ribosomal protein L6 [Candidatus Ryanbacteria bacterium RIFCSPHIGHO2_02_FULL_47_25]OGZ51320.1 MAG: 50S ribosomal protein L6 [Candidatus Ryanbacteria bacterium RIFCSPHIGHO2_12_FULL_47_12b]OGZ52220.1 MAG: 
MSRIGKKSVTVPEGVNVTISETKVEVKGPRGVLDLKIPRGISVSLEDGKLITRPLEETHDTKKLWGTVRSLLANMVEGVTQGFEKKLVIEGVGYRASVSGKNLELSLGFSHPVKVEAPEGVEFKVEKNTILVSGFSKEKIGRVAAEIRALKKPEPYKGKGIHYFGEIIRRKAGKKATSSG